VVAPTTRTKSFDAHDALKALGAKYNIPTQVLNDRVFTFTIDNFIIHDNR
jgi:hypothetical protein